MQYATFYDLEWDKGGVDFYISTDEDIPYNAKRCDDGLYRLTIPASLRLCLKLSDGSIAKIEVKDLVRKTNCWQRLSQNRFERLFVAFSRKFRFEVKYQGDQVTVNSRDIIDLVKECR